MTAMSGSASETIAVIGLGYVGLPVVLGFGRRFPTIGFDVNNRRVEELAAGRDANGEHGAEEFAAAKVRWTSDPAALAEATFLIVAVPTPVDANHRPDLQPLLKASEIVGAHIRRGAVVVFESTVYPGVTEEVCAPVIERVSGLKSGTDFFLGYSPERINPGDKERTFERILKVVSGQDAATLDRVARVYGAVVAAGVHRASSIKVAEACKVIENVQRDLNIALMNELAIIFDHMDIRTVDVLEAAGTKWNFVRMTPGLVGGHCIGVDPYYLTTRSEQLGYQPELILASRRINNDIGQYVARKTIKMVAGCDVPPSRARVAVLGLTFKENVADLRNSRVPDILRELADFGYQPLIHDPLADPEEARHEYGVELCSWEQIRDLDALIIAVSHRFYIDHGIDNLVGRVRDNGAIVDIKSVLKPDQVRRGIRYWSL
jgi:UDP-N-acetyl-D-galactosamine dehydrogenase